MTSCRSVPSVRIWIMGTHRVLGIEDAVGDPAGDNMLLECLNKPMLSGTPCTKVAFGDFTVCPLPPQQPSVMQRACVVSAKKIVINSLAALYPRLHAEADQNGSDLRQTGAFVFSTVGSTLSSPFNLAGIALNGE